ncbi:hypothetical protein SAMN04487949_2815 [Halogranum gelatinilyticum]|uniref:Uncharacterized protein n=1 Tax=Halogranum gelatinilyticum TaxID=660521 RepID=A0A1G9X2S5_9EURY|nr:hypothetical protein [Halogranum gelatinilyticum]SDM90982.1 hypothetical protein SAMN04487949_2815 [Halogranum gelatinilyticum]
MSFGDDAPDRLAYDLAQSDFDAVERDGYRAEWGDDDSTVDVLALGGDERIVYDAEDLLRAESDTEVRNARNV